MDAGIIQSPVEPAMHIYYPGHVQVSRTGERSRLKCFSRPVTMSQNRYISQAGQQRPAADLTEPQDALFQHIYLQQCFAFTDQRFAALLKRFIQRFIVTCVIA